MFTLAHHPYASPYQSYNPYEQLLLQQELQRRRNAEAYRRRQLEIEELNRQYEYARRQAELQRRQQLAMEMERNARRRELGGHARGCRHSMYDSGAQNLFDALYGRQLRSTSPRDRRSTSDERSGSQEHITLEQAHVDKSGIPDQQRSVPPESSEPTLPSPTLPTEPEVGPTETEGHSQLDTGASHAAISGILATFGSLSSNFTFPPRLEFAPTSSSDSPKLAYTPINAPLHQYEHVLTGLLTQLDAVESFGDEEVRKARKEAVRRIEKELEDMDGRKLEEWRRQSTPAIEPEVESQSEADGTSAVVDPLLVPLPQDGGDEQLDDTISEPPVAVLATAPSPSHSTLTLSPKAPELNQTSLAEASASETSDSEVEEYVDVDLISGSSAGEETEEVDHNGGLVAMDEWDMDF